MKDPKKNGIAEFFQPASVRLTFWLFRGTWKLAAGVVGLTFRICAAVILALWRR